MNEQDKQLLLKDLCAMLPYGVILHDEYCKKDYKLNSIDANGFINYDIANSITHVKPYLRPMSSMTEEEDLEFIGIGLSVVNYGTNGNAKHKCKLSIPEIDWLNAHHFDYRGLIEKGLALEAPEEMYKV